MSRQSDCAQTPGEAGEEKHKILERVSDLLQQNTEEVDIGYNTCPAKSADEQKDKGDIVGYV